MSAELQRLERKIDFLIEDRKVLLQELAQFRQLVSKLYDQDANQIIGVNDAAKLAGVSRQTVQNWIYSGALPYEQPTPNGKCLIRKQDLNDFIEMKKSKKARSS